MRYIDVFHGDADGICALHQLRLVEPVPAGAQLQLVSGLKREIDLLTEVTGGPDCAVTVLDVSLERNRDHLVRLLARGAWVRYFDHHFAEAIPVHPRLHAVIEEAPDVCTSILVDRHIGGRHRAWAVVGAFGDNLHAVARSLAASLDLREGQLDTLRALGEVLNYNAYGETAADVMIEPVDLYKALHRHADPFEFAATPLVRQMLARSREDLSTALGVAPVLQTRHCAVFRLPNTPWAARVIGSFANTLAHGHPRRAHAVLRERGDGTFTVSVRAPLAEPHGADRLCRHYASGGGRAAAAGIDRLDATQLDAFVHMFSEARWEAAATLSD
ncbi:MAG TPA: acetyltransferase [Burkholderiaceae bacterium]|nr:acetyltransferase [Burkholderiaceae bacterium]